MANEFKAAWQQLNARQKEAVEHIEGPLLVIAGPGTGKTQLLGMRAANILTKTDTDPSSILCLTFTNFAANNMRERLHRLIGPTAKNVVVRTFHSFAAEIMELYPEHFWNGASLQTAPDAVQISIIKQILAELPLDDPLAMRYAGQLTLVNDVQQSIKLAREAGFTPHELASTIKSNLSYIDQIESQAADIVPQVLSIKNIEALPSEIQNLPDQALVDSSQILLKPLSEVLKSTLNDAVSADLKLGKTTNTGRWKRRWLQNIDGRKRMLDERRRNEWWLSVARVYQQYRDLLHGSGYYDYSDMIIEVNTQLESNNELRAMVQERFLYIQIDEFQDTNAAQLKLASLVASHPSDEGRPNIMAVGDDDQSIFAFNGAELNNMLSFRDSYKGVKTIVLADNYRSTNNVLSTSAGIISNAEMRVVTATGLDKNLKAVNGSNKGTISHIVHPTYQHHINLLADKIKQDFAGHQTIAVLARQHSTLRDMASCLTSKNVPITYEQQNNSLDQPLVRSVNIIAEAVHAIKTGNQETSDYYISHLLADKPWQINETTLWQIGLTMRGKPDWLGYLKTAKDKRLSALANWLLWLARESSSVKLPHLIDYMIGLSSGEHLTSPIREHYFVGKNISASYLTNISALNCVLSATKEIAETKQGKTTLSDYIDFINLQQTLAKPLTDTSWFASGSRSVELLTVHKAKGLEFDIVYILDVTESGWKPRRQGRKPPANLPLQPYGESYDDYVRLMYVAATRAKHTIYAGSYQYDNKGEKLLASPLIEHLPVIVEEPTESESIQSLESSLRWPALDTKDQQSLLKKYMEDFSLSASSMLDFLDITSGGPEHFLERYILRLPEAKTADMAFGTAMHKALQTAQILTNTNKFSLKKVLNSFEEALLKESLSQNNFDKYLLLGTEELSRLINEDILALKKGDYSEYAINNVRVGKAYLGGKLDHLHTSHSQIVVTDYKTGNYLSSFTTHDQTKAIKAWRHKTQLLFYGLLIESDGRIKQKAPITGRMAYIEANEPKNIFLSLELDREELDQTAELAQKIWQHICSLSFPDTRHYTQDIAGINKFASDILQNKLPLKN